MFLQTTGQCTGAIVKVPESRVLRLVLVSANVAVTLVACFFELGGKLSSSRSWRAGPSV